MSNGTNPPKKRGCLFYGCLSMVGVGLVIVVVGLLAFYLARQWGIKQLNAYTDASQTKFEYPNYSAGDRAKLEARLQGLADAIKQGQGSRELVLTADDINELISKSKDYQGKVLVSIEDDRVRGKVSLPLNDVIPPELRSRLRILQNRYLNAEVAFRVALEGGALDVRLDEILAKGKPMDKAPLIGPMIADMKKRNLAQEAQQNSKDMDYIRQCESIVVKDGKFIIRSK
jgi:hypothetical protein